MKIILELWGFRREYETGRDVRRAYDFPIIIMRECSWCRKEFQLPHMSNLRLRFLPSSRLSTKRTVVYEIDVDDLFAQILKESH